MNNNYFNYVGNPFMRNMVPVNMTRNIGFMRAPLPRISSFFAPSRASLFGVSRGIGATSFGASKLSFSKILSGTSKTLNVVNQAIPVFYQAKPIFKNAKTMLRVVRELNTNGGSRNNSFKDKESNIDKTTLVAVKKDAKKKEYSDNSPTFFI